MYVFNTAFWLPRWELGSVALLCILASTLSLVYPNVEALMFVDQ